MSFLNKFATAYRSFTGSGYSTRSFADRLSIQKIGYILEQKGIDLRYNFFWHIHGVFSYNLWNETILKTPETERLSEEDIQKIRQLKSDSEFQRLITDVDRLELATSLLYWSKRAKLNFDDIKLIITVREFKPRFSEEEAKREIPILKRHFT